MTDNKGRPLNYDPEGLSDEEISLLEEQDGAGFDEEEDFEVEAGGEEGEETNTEGDPSLAAEQDGEEGKTEEGKEGDTQVQKNEGDKPPSGFVPIGALHQARMREREAQTKLQEMQQTVAAILAKVNGQKEEQEEEDTPDENDPVGAIEFLLGQEKARKEALRAQQEEQARQQELTNFRMDVAREFDEQAAQDQEAQEAFEFLGLHARYEYNQLYANSGMTFEQYQQELITNHAIYARRNGIPMAEYVKKYATTRGYSPGIVAQMKQRAQGANNPQQSQVSEEIKKARQRSEMADRNIKIRGGSSGGKGEITLEDLAKMSGSQIERLVERNPDILEKLTGVA